MDIEDPLLRLRALFPDAQRESSASELLSMFGSPAQALLCAAGMFFPDLCEVDGSVLLPSLVETEKARLGFVECVRRDGRQAAEESFNFTEVAYLFNGRRNEVTDQDDEYLARYLRVSWQGWLAYRYPGRQFKVSLLPPEVSGSVFSVTFCEIREHDVDA